MEVDFHMKANEIEYIRKLIKVKQLQSRAKQRPKKTIKENPVLNVMECTVIRHLPTVTDPVEKKMKSPGVRRKNSAANAKAAAKNSQRDKWLYRQPSTVQLYPAVNGRQRCYDNEVKNIFS